MRIALTGGSSFTGMWFALALARSGHEVTVLLRKKKEEYDGLRLERIKKTSKFVRFLEAGPFGSELFFSSLKQLPSLDLFCHHASLVENYKSPNFPYLLALEQNSKGLQTLLSLLEEKKCFHLCLTGSVFERGEGKGSDALKAVSPYGLSKTLTYEVFRYYCQERGFSLGKFVIPNPFGPYEEERFCFSLMKSWAEEKIAVVNTPEYIRDNIPVQLLAACYSSFCGSLVKQREGFIRINPSCYAESQKSFTQLFQKKMRERMPLACEVQFLEQTKWLEPLERVNTDRIYFGDFKLEEEILWDEIAAYYQQKLTLPLSV